MTTAKATTEKWEPAHYRSASADLVPRYSRSVHLSGVYNATVVLSVERGARCRWACGERERWGWKVEASGRGGVIAQGESANLIAAKRAAEAALAGIGVGA